MTPNPQQDFEDLRCCVIVPTYNNAASLGGVLENIRQYSPHIIVVNDGATDNTAYILSRFAPEHLISYPLNRGKGYALRQAFDVAWKAGYEYAITIDSDGQHAPAEMLLLLNCLKENPGAMIVGARNMTQEGIPRKSSFGHKFSNFWFRFETGIELPDTQSGYRLYPLEPISRMKLYTDKYELEIEVLVRLTWKNIPVLHVPVSVKYEPKESRVSHFRPFRDFSRVSVLNVVLVFVTICWILPLKFFSKLNKKDIKQFIQTDLIASHESNTTKVLSVMLGIFMGILPVWGFQMIIALALAYAFRLNKVLVIVAANISLPPLVPIILYVSYKTGGLLMNSPSNLAYDQYFTFEIIQHNVLQYLLGSIVFGVFLALFTGVLSWFLLMFFRRKK
ncbi:MAG: DUF2062 domain-containing protein [Bacteroidota bacterium]